MADLEQSLRNLTLAPYIVKAMALIGVKRRGGSNMFRHQLSTLAILLDYKIDDPVLLKAAVIHDLFEDAPTMPGVTEGEIVRIDADGSAVYALVMEVTIRTADGVREPKSEYLLRIMQSGSTRAKLLKLADRISNLTALGFVHDAAISSLTYGLKAGHRGVVLVIPWEVTEQYTSDAHYVLTIVYRDQSGTEQASVFELGKALVRPTLEVLERRSGIAVEFQNVEACVLFRTAEACGYGKPAELTGLTKVFLDARGENRELILVELKKAGTGLEVIDDSAAAEVLVTFGTERSMDPRCPCEGGRGEATVGQGARRRVVLVYADRKMGVWGKKPATNFGIALAEAFRAANEPAKMAK